MFLLHYSITASLDYRLDLLLSNVNVGHLLKQFDQLASALDLPRLELQFSYQSIGQALVCLSVLGSLAGFPESRLEVVPNLEYREGIG